MRSPLRSLLVTSLMVAGVLATAAPATASHDVTPARVAGEDREGTAAEVATLQYDTASDAILAAKATFPDALASAPLAGELDAPILLTGQDEVPDVTLEALDALDTNRVIVVGGPAAVSVDVEDELRDRGHEVVRIEGETRFETAADIAATVQDAQDNTANFPGDVRAAFLANGYRFPDALAAGAPAAHDPAQIPIVLSEQAEVPAATWEFLESYEIETVFVVGGPVAIDDAVVAELESRDYTVDRIAGDTRTDTATEMADFAIEFLGFDASNPALARGDTFPDALAIGPFQAAQESPILLTEDPNTLTDYTATWLAEACPEVEVVRAVGGELALTTSTLERAEDAAQSCHVQGPPTDDDAQDYVVAPQEALTSTPGDPVQFTTGARYDDGEFADALDVALFPCNNTDVEGAGEPVLVDADGDGYADDIYSTDTGSASIIAVDDAPPAGGDPVKGLDEAATGADDELSVQIDSNTADCTVVVFFEDVDDDNQLSVDDQGHPREPYGVGKVIFE